MPAEIQGVVIINGHDYTRYVKQKTGILWSRENTNSKDAGRDTGERMHPCVTSHQRKINFKMGPMPFSVGQQLERDLEAGDDGVSLTIPDLHDGICTRLFYNTSIQAAEEQFTDDGVLLDNVTFSLTSIQE